MTKNMDATAGFLLALAAIAWALLAFDLYGIVSAGVPLGGESRYSRGWELLWAYALAFAVWVLLGIMVYRFQLPGAWLVYAITAAAAISAFLLMGDGESTWPAFAALLLPVLILGAALNSHWISLRIPLVVLSAVPCAIAAWTFGSSALNDWRAQSAVSAETRRANLAIVATIDENKPIWQLLPLLKEESGVRKEALAAMTKLARRQQDIEAMMRGDYGGEAMELIPLLNLQPTTQLQQFVNAYAVKTAEYARTKPGGGDEILERDFTWGPLPALQWLHAHGGDCREGASQLKSAALEYRDTKTRTRYLKQLDDMLK